MPTSSHRLRFNFWLNRDKPEEELIADKIEQLKRERSFTSVIRDGIRLICDLREGNLDVLFDFFPWVKAEFLAYMRELQPTEPAPVASETKQSTVAEQAWLEAEQERFEAERQWHEEQLEVAKQALEQERQQLQAERTATQNKIQQQLDRLEALLIAQGHQPIDGALKAVTSSNEGGIKPIDGALKPLTSLPTYDDDDDSLLEVKPATTPAGGKTAAQNFIAAMFALSEQPSTGSPGPRRRGKQTGA